MSVSVTLQPLLKIAELLSLIDASTTAATINHDIAALYPSTTLNSGSTPAVSKTASFSKALSSGAATIDMTALVGTNAGAVDFTGLKLNVAFFMNPATNANAITIVGGASNGNLIFGTAGSIVLQPGEWVLLFGNAKKTVVDGSHKTIDISGTAAQALSCVLVAG